MISDTSAIGIADRIRAGAESSVSVLSATLRRLGEVGERRSGLVYVEAEATLLERAAKLDASVGRGIDPGVLTGVPIAIKDVEDVAGMPTTYGSELLSASAAADSAHVARLRDAGAILIGKTNLPEFGHGLNTSNRRFGQTPNPVNDDLTPGGSSGGSAAAVASGVVPLASGTDGGGSVRIPAAFCNLIGLKPTAGTIPIDNPGWGSLSHIGILGSSISDVSRYLDVVSGPSSKDRRSLPKAPTSAEAAVHRAVDISGLRFVASHDLAGASASETVRSAFERVRTQLTQAGARVVDPPTQIPEVLEAFVSLASHWDAARHASLTPSQHATLSGSYQRWLERGRQVTATDIVKAQELRTSVYESVETWLVGSDFLLTPTVGVEPWSTRERLAFDPLQHLFTHVFNLTGHPAISIPIPGTLIGLQLVGPRFSDDSVLACAAAVMALMEAQKERGRFPVVEHRL